MKKLLPGFNKLIVVSIIILLTGIFNPANSQQQQYANAYTYWDFGEDANDVQNVEQKIWIAMPAFSTQWVMSWAFITHHRIPLIDYFYIKKSHEIFFLFYSFIGSRCRM